MTKPLPNPDPTAVAFRAKRKRGPATCLHCGKDFVGQLGARFCSDACRYRAAYLTRKTPPPPTD